MTSPRLGRMTSAAITTNLILQLLIIVTGGAVRLTASGLGCSTWPNCEPGAFLPATQSEWSIHPYVEFGNRIISAVVVAVAIVMFVLVWQRRRERSRGFVWLAALPAIITALQAGLGAITVLTELHPAIVGSHFILSAALVWISTWLWVRWRSGDGPVQNLAVAPLNYLAGILAGVAAIIVVLGMIVTGSGPHSGDAEVGYRFAVNPLIATRSHSVAVWVFVIVLTVYAVAVYKRSRTDADYRPVLRGALLIAWVVAAQGALGYWQYFTGLPESVVLAHLLGSALFILTVTYGLLSLRPREVTPAEELATSSTAS